MIANKPENETILKNTYLRLNYCIFYIVSSGIYLKKKSLMHSRYKVLNKDTKLELTFFSVSEPNNAKFESFQSYFFAFRSPDILNSCSS